MHINEQRTHIIAPGAGRPIGLKYVAHPTFGQTTSYTPPVSRVSS